MFHATAAEHFTASAHLTLARKLPERQTAVLEFTIAQGLTCFQKPTRGMGTADAKFSMLSLEAKSKKKKADSTGLGNWETLNETGDSASQAKWPLPLTSHKHNCKIMLLTAPK